MHDRTRKFTGTALALIMLAGTSHAVPRIGVGPEANLVPPKAAGVPLLLAQAQEEGLSEEELLRRQQEQAPPPEEAPAAQEPPVPEPEPAPQAEPAPAPEAAPEPAPTPESAPEAAPEQDAAPQQDSEPAPEQPAETPESPPVPQEAPAPTAPEAPPTPTEAPPAPTPEEVPVPQEAPPAEQPAPEPTQPTSGAEPVPDQPAPPAAEQTPPPPADGSQPPAQEGTPPSGSGTEPLPGESTPPPAGQPTPPEGQAPTPPAPGVPPAGGGTEPVGDTAPLLDSAKEAEDAAPAPTAGEAPQAPAAVAPPPVSDQEAQQFEAPVEVQTLRAEEGRRIERREERRERPEGSSVLREIGDRFVIQLGQQVIVQSDDRGRIGRNAEEVYYEELPRGRTRETVVRPNGVQVVTVYDRYGDVIRRSRITPDGREYFLVYANDRREREREDRREWRDPGRDLPPLRLNIPANEYILDAGSVRDVDAYYDFLDQPPVEPVRRLYSVDEVRYSARVRDSVRRVELDTITFDTGSAAIAQSALSRLDGVARAMERLLDENPGEVFLIEGHTDAVGSDDSNLALSDRRAEGVAQALTDAFGIPPENLVTQGYGERYLKISTDQAERANRRVAIRRITPLVAPVASAQ